MRPEPELCVKSIRDSAPYTKLLLITLICFMFFSSGCAFLEAIPATLIGGYVYLCATAEPIQPTAPSHKYYKEGIESYKQFKYEKAKKLLDKALDKQRLNRHRKGKALTYKGASEHMMGKPNEAKKSFKKAKNAGARIDKNEFKPAIVECFEDDE